MNECFVSYLTIRKHAPSRTAFILTSKSMGKLMPKLSVSVSDSLMKPLHCLLMRPTDCPSLTVICKRGQINTLNLLSNYYIVFLDCTTQTLKIIVKSLKKSFTPAWQTGTITHKYIRQNPHLHSS